MSKTVESVRGVRVLIVEDEVLIAEEIRERLSRLGAEVVDVVDTGVDAGRAAAQHHPDIVLMDIRLKGSLTGIEAAEAIQRNLQIPVVFLTAHSDWETVLRARTADPFGYVLKPFQESDLVATIQIALRRHGLEERLFESERRYEATLSSIGEGVIATDTAGRITFLNPVAEAITQWNLDDARGLAINIVFPVIVDSTGEKSDCPALQALFRKQLIKTREPVLLVARDGERILIEISAAPIFGTTDRQQMLGAVVAFRDVRERRRAEVALRESEARYRAVVEMQTDFIVRWLPDGTRTFVNEAYARYFCRNREDLIGSSFFPLIQTEEERENVRRKLTALTPENPTIVNEHRALRHDGQWRWQEWIDRGLFDDMGQLIELQSVGRDIHERVTFEQQLMESRRLLEQAQQVGHIGSWISDANREGWLEWSAETCRIFGVAPEEFDGQVATFFDLVHPDDRDAITEAVQAAFDGERTYHLEHRIVRRDGQVRWLSEQAEVERHPDGTPIRMIGVVQDITERKETEETLRLHEQERRRLEDQIRHSRRLESVGRLASGVAHDFNNLLTVISCCSEVLLMENRLDATSRQLLVEIRSAGERAARLTSQLLAFSRKQVLQPSVIDLGKLISDTGSMLERLLGEDVELRITAGPALWSVQVDPGQIEQVIVNLAVNARDAMPRGGRLLIETSNVDVTEDSLDGDIELEPGRYVSLQISDTGIGMSPEIQERAFEPFFTTREKGRGTGLGLATVYGIVKQSGGAIHLHSEVGKGTDFTLFFPATAAETTPEPQVTDHATAIRGAGHLLLVEDDAAVRLLLSSALTTCGYTVYEADSGPAALRLFEQHPDSIQLVVTDVVMPGMSGRELIESIRRISPTVRCLYLSGYTDDAVVRHGILRREVAFLQKPFTLNALARKVREVLFSPDRQSVPPV